MGLEFDIDMTPPTGWNVPCCACWLCIRGDNSSCVPACRQQNRLLVIHHHHHHHPYNKTNYMHWFLKFIFGIKLYMFRTVPLSIISSFSLYTQQWYMSYSLRAGSGRNCSSVVILLASCQQTCIAYTIAVCIVKNSWWWTEELSETCRVLFQK